MRTQSTVEGGSGPLRLITHEGTEPLDRWTLVPADLDSERQYTAWLTVDTDSVLDLADCR